MSLLNMGHFAVETHGEQIVSRIKNFFIKLQSKAA